MLNEADLHRRYLSERMGPKAVERRGSKDGDDEEVESAMHFVGERSNRQNYKGA